MFGLVLIMTYLGE